MIFTNIDILMRNSLQFSDCNNPGIPMPDRDPVDETLHVIINGSLISVAALTVKPQDAPQKNDPIADRLYGRHTLTIDNTGSDTTLSTDLFLILPELPPDPGANQLSYFPAIGTIAFWRDAKGEFRLRAAGTDMNSGGVCRGWIFNAVEI